MIHETQNPKLKPAAQKLRKDMTREERHLWYDFLKTLPVNVNRQKVIGPYIVDFYISRAKIVIELDGSQHYEPEHRRMDLARDEYLAALGLQVLRYSNADVRERFSAVCTDIWKHVFSDEGPHPSFASQMPAPFSKGALGAGTDRFAPKSPPCQRGEGRRTQSGGGGILYFECKSFQCCCHELPEI